MRWLLLLACVLVVCSAAWADVYKCPDGKGGLVLQTAPCPGSDPALPPTEGPTRRRRPAPIETETFATFQARARQARAVEEAQAQHVKTVIQATALPSQYQQDIDAHMVTLLKDPDSRRLTYLRTPYGALVCGTVNAKNAFGGYTGPQPFFAYFDAQAVLITVKIYTPRDLADIPYGSAVDQLLMQDCGFADR